MPARIIDFAFEARRRAKARHAIGTSAALLRAYNELAAEEFAAVRKSIEPPTETKVCKWFGDRCVLVPLRMLNDDGSVKPEYANEPLEPLQGYDTADPAKWDDD